MCVVVWARAGCRRAEGDVAGGVFFWYERKSARVCLFFYRTTKIPGYYIITLWRTSSDEFNMYSIRT